MFVLAAKVLEDLEDTIKKVLWEYQDKFLLPAARERLAAHGLSPQSKYDDVKDKFAINLADYFNLLAGTSTGGLLSLYCESLAACWTIAAAAVWHTAVQHTAARIRAPAGCTAHYLILI
jgi:hypothetical protein